MSVRWSVTTVAGGALLAVAGLAPARAEDVADLARQAAERDARALVWLLREGIRPKPAVPVHDDQRQAQVAQHAKQMEKMFQVLLAGELELARRFCGDLAPAVRQKILDEGRHAVAEAARGFSERQFNGQLGRDVFDPREEVRTRLVAAVDALATPEQAAAYRTAIEQRQARRAEAARTSIVARLDRQLDLTARQREAIEADLERLWRPDWALVLDDHGILIGRYPLAPDMATAAIRPHLGQAQVAEWETWCRMAGSRTFQHRGHWRFDGQGIQAVDAWWGR